MDMNDAGNDMIGSDKHCRLIDSLTVDSVITYDQDNIRSSWPYLDDRPTQHSVLSPRLTVTLSSAVGKQSPHLLPFCPTKTDNVGDITVIDAPKGPSPKPKPGKRR